MLVCIVLFFYLEYVCGCILLCAAAVSQGKVDMEQSLEKVRNLEVIRNTIQHQLMQKDQEYARQLRDERIRSEENAKQLLKDLVGRLRLWSNFSSHLCNCIVEYLCVIGAEFSFL